MRIARNNRPVCTASETQRGSRAENRRISVRVHDSYRTFSHGWALPTHNDKRAHYPAGPQGAMQGPSFRHLMQVHSFGHFVVLRWLRLLRRWRHQSTPALVRRPGGARFASANQAVRVWRQWLSRRDRQGVVTWTCLLDMINADKVNTLFSPLLSGQYLNKFSWLSSMTYAEPLAV
jgi:hypothetical protein